MMRGEGGWIWHRTRDGEALGINRHGAAKMNDGRVFTAMNHDAIAGTCRAGDDFVSEGDAGHLGIGTEKCGWLAEGVAGAKTGGVAVVVQVEGGDATAVTIADVSPVPEIAVEAAFEEAGIDTDATSDSAEAAGVKFRGDLFKRGEVEHRIAPANEDEITFEEAILHWRNRSKLGHEAKIGAEDFERGGGGDGFEGGGWDEGGVSLVIENDIALRIEHTEADGSAAKTRGGFGLREQVSEVGLPFGLR